MCYAPRRIYTIPCTYGVLSDNGHSASGEDAQAAAAAIAHWTTSSVGITTDDVDALNAVLAECVARLDRHRGDGRVDVAPLRRGFRVQPPHGGGASPQSRHGDLRSALQLLYPDVERESAVVS